MKRVTGILLVMMLIAALTFPSAYADEPGVVTTLDENGNTVTQVVDANGNRMTIEVIDDDLQDEMDIDWIEEEDSNPEDMPDEPGDAGGDTVPDGDAPADAPADDGADGAGAAGLTTGRNAQSKSGQADAAEAAPAADDTNKETSAPLVEQIKDALPESIQALVTPDENGSAAISDTTLILILIVLLVLLLVIVAGIVLVIVLVLTRRKKDAASARTADAAEPEQKDGEGK